MALCFGSAKTIQPLDMLNMRRRSPVERRSKTFYNKDGFSSGKNSIIEKTFHGMIREILKRTKKQRCKDRMQERRAPCCRSEL